MLLERLSVCDITRIRPCQTLLRLWAPCFSAHNHGTACLNAPMNPSVQGPPSPPMAASPYAGTGAREILFRKAPSSSQTRFLDSLAASPIRCATLRSFQDLAILPSLRDPEQCASRSCAGGTETTVLTPRSQQRRNSDRKSGPDGIIRRAHITHDSGEGWVGIDDLVLRAGDRHGG
jgi:hypothetical protein